MNVHNGSHGVQAYTTNPFIVQERTCTARLHCACQALIEHLRYYRKQQLSWWS